MLGFGSFVEFSFFFFSPYLFSFFLILIFKPIFMFSTFIHLFAFTGASLVAQRLKHLPEMWETQVQSLGQEDILEKEMATHSSTLT